MRTRTNKNVANLSLIRGGLQDGPSPSPELQLERNVREQFVAIRSTVKDRAISNVARDATHPTRVLARLLRKAKAHRAPYQHVKKIALEYVHYVDRLYGHVEDTAA